jgi:hypothetical protein
LFDLRFFYSFHFLIVSILVAWFIILALSELVDASQSGHVDLLNFLIEASEDGQSLTNEELIQLCLTFLIAGIALLLRCIFFFFLILSLMMY